MDDKKYGVTQEYNRANYETAREKKIQKEVKGDFFGNEKVKIDSNNNMLHKDTNAARRKYKSSTYARHVVEPDHIDPISNAHSRNKNKKYINDDDIREVVNRKSNIQIITKEINTAKGRKTNLEALKQEKVYRNLSTTEKIKFAVDGVIQEKSTDVQLSFRNAKGCVEYHSEKIKNDISNEEIISNKKDVIFMSLISTSISNIMLVASNEKEIDEAMKDIGKDVGNDLIKAISLDGIQLLLKEIGIGGNKDLPIFEVLTAINMGSYVIDFINDEITAEECVRKILDNGIGMLAYGLGLSLGGPIGAMVASTVTSFVLSEIDRIVNEYREISKHNKMIISRINSISNEAVVEIKRQRENLEEIISNENINFDNSVDQGFKNIFKGTINNDVSLVANGLDDILKIFNKESLFKSRDEFDYFFDNENSILQF